MGKKNLDALQPGNGATVTYMFMYNNCYYVLRA